VKRLAMIGTEIIHTYPYLSYFNGFDPELVRKNAKPWMAALLEGKSPEPRSSNVRITHVWAGEREEAERLAESCGVENVADSPHEFIGQVDGVMVMDEKIEERARLMRPFIEAGKAVFVDKILSLEPGVTEELLQLADAKGSPVAACSQLRFAPGVRGIAEKPRGGVALMSFRIRLEVLPFYAIHLISAAHGVFGANAACARKVSNGNGVTLHILQRDGTQLLLYLSPDAPPGLNICYFSKEGGCLAEGGDKYEMFASCARAIEEMVVTGRSFVPREEMLEATRLVNIIVNAKVGEQTALA